ncbi:hypothetical protein RUM44_013011 [Polyplax serrata]|uniref:Uncharacterized protein n=1 Tax=Polyplax serrata TaxID=468196 RepID=A0ABR1BD91_POLSC
MLTLKGVYTSGYTMLLLSILSFAGIIYMIEEFKRIERELELKRQEEAARLEELKKQEKKKKKKSRGRGC